MQWREAKETKQQITIFVFLTEGVRARMPTEPIATEEEEEGEEEDE